jgi:NAD(P) transhydrogenase subunit alpha
MVIGVPRELQPGEQRAALIPASIQKLVRAGAQVVIESGLGLGAGHSDEDYATAGAHVTHDRAALLAQSELVLRLHKPPVAEIAQLKRGAIHISYLDPFNEPALIDAFGAPASPRSAWK